MTAFALTLLLCAGFVHAGWNYLAKKVGGGPVFLWMIAIVSTLMYAPLAAGAIWWSKFHIGLLEWLLEQEARRRIPAALVIVAGIVALAVG